MLQSVWPDFDANDVYLESVGPQKIGRRRVMGGATRPLP